MPESTTKAIRELRNAGNYAFCAAAEAGRTSAVRRSLESDLTGLWRRAGTHIEYEGKKVSERLLTPREVEELLRVIGAYHIEAVLEGPRYIYANGEDFKEDPFIQYLRRELGEDVREIRGQTEYEINKLSAYMNGASVRAVEAELVPHFDVIEHNPQLIEVVPKGYTKATGIAQVCDMLGIARENTYAFGDSTNDLEMLTYVGHGIAMGNGGTCGEGCRGVCDDRYYESWN